MSGSHGGLGVGDIVTGLRILLAVQWSGLLAFTSKDQGSTLIGELRSRKPCGVALTPAQKKQV